MSQLLVSIVCLGVPIFFFSFNVNNNTIILFFNYEYNIYRWYTSFKNIIIVINVNIYFYCRLPMRYATCLYKNWTNYLFHGFWKYTLLRSFVLLVQMRFIVKYYLSSVSFDVIRAFSFRCMFCLYFLIASGPFLTTKKHRVRKWKIIINHKIQLFCNNILPIFQKKIIFYFSLQRSNEFVLFKTT